MLYYAGLEVFEREDPMFGSWFRRIWVVRKEPSDLQGSGGARRSAKYRNDEAKDAEITATMLKNLTPLIKALQPTSDALIRVREILIVKIDGVLMVYLLRAQEQRQLDDEPSLASSPREILARLGISSTSAIQLPPEQDPPPSHDGEVRGDARTARFAVAQGPVGAGVDIDRSAGAQIGSGNVQVNHFYSHPAWPADGESTESGSPQWLGRGTPASAAPGRQLPGAGGGQALAGTIGDRDGLFLRAVEQLGSGEEPVRVSALHALDRLGQNNSGLRQTVIEVICAYLRMPYSRFSESPASDPAVQTSWQKELQVRLTAQSIVAGHLRDDLYRGQRLDGSIPVTFWPEIESVDLRGAHLVDLNLSGCRVHALECRDATFAGESLFRGLICDLAFFQKAVFEGIVDFRGAVFTNDAWFSWATFSADVWFHGDEFFPAARFGRHAGFKEVTFAREARFEQAIFEGSADFEAITCQIGITAINLDGCQVSRPDAVNPDPSKTRSIWPPDWHIQHGHNGTATTIRRK